MKRWSLVLLSTVLAAACSRAPDGENGSVGAISLFDPVAANPSLCGGPAIPFPNDALFADATSPTGITRDTTIALPASPSTAAAASLTDGWSTTASIFTDVLGPVDYSTAANAIQILETDSDPVTAGAQPRLLVAGVDFTVQPSIAMAQFSGTGPAAGTCSAGPPPGGYARFLPINQQRSRLLIEPLIPLKPSTTYIVAVTKSLRSVDGVAARENEFFRIVNRGTRLCYRLDITPPDTPGAGELDCANTATPALLAAALGEPVLGALAAAPTTPVQKLQTLETLRRNLVFPTVAGFKAGYNALNGSVPDITDADLVIAWKFTTQSVSKSLSIVNSTATAKTFTVVNTGLNTGTASGGALAATADIFAGTFNAVPYYLDDASDPTDAPSQSGTPPATGFWLSTGTGGRDNAAVVAALNNAPCAAPGPFAGFLFEPSVSTTNCFPTPFERSAENLPILVTVPNASCNAATPAICVKPAGGWPVVIFQHGITGNRTQMLPIGAALAAAGMVTVAIDLPLHGVAPGAGFYSVGNERTFDLDISAAAAGNACGSGTDGTTDPSGTCFINLGSLTTSRDNLRQAVADLIHLTRSLAVGGGAEVMNLDGVAGDDIDETKIRFAGISLGGIVGGTLLGVNSEITAASLNVPGGGIGKLLDASKTFGPVIAGGLASVAVATDLAGASSPFEGTDTYETFVRFAQHLVDPGDPINFAVAANAGHRIHLVEVIGDTVVPNTADTTCTTSTLPAGAGATAASHTTTDTRAAAYAAGAALVGAFSTLFPAPTSTALCPGNASQDETLLAGYLSGTEPLFGEMGLTVLGPITPPATASVVTDNNGLDRVVQFAIGTHGSLLTPAGPEGATQFLAVTQEMQRQTAEFLRTNGTCLSIGGGACP